MGPANGRVERHQKEVQEVWVRKGPLACASRYVTHGERFQLAR